MGSAVTVPAEWPLMLVEIFVASDGAILMTSVLGVPKNCVEAFFGQGAYVELNDTNARVVTIGAQTGYFLPVILQTLNGTLTTNHTSRAANSAMRASDSRLMPDEFDRMPENAAFFFACPI